MQLFDLTDKNVLITGGTRGIGYAIAQGVKQAGGRVWIHGSSEDRTRRIAEENGFDYLYGDLRDQERLDGMLRPFLTREDRLDVLINNAGVQFGLNTHVLEITSGVLIVFAVTMDMVKNRKKA